MPTGAESLVDMRGTDMFGDSHGDLMLGYGLASNLVYVFETDVDEVDFIRGSFFKAIEDTEGVQGAMLMATVVVVARCEATVLYENEVKCASLCAEPEVEGCSVEDAGYTLEMLETMEGVGPMPCNTLSMPEEAAVITTVCNVV